MAIKYDLIDGVRVIDVKASDNKYLHKDFHGGPGGGGMNGAIKYLGDTYGENAVKDYLRKFSAVFYAPLIEDIKARGLKAMEEKILHDYAEEEVPEDCHTTLTDTELTVVIDKCPAVMHIKSFGYSPCKWFKYTTSEVYDEIANRSNYGFEVEYYNEENGATKYRFFKRGGRK